MRYDIMVRCENGHEQRIKFDGRAFNKQFVKTQAGLLDGSSPMYAQPPGKDSIIGKCSICLSQIKCTIVDVPKEAKCG